MKDSLTSFNLITNQTYHVQEKKGPQTQLPTRVRKALYLRQTFHLQSDAAHGEREGGVTDPKRTEAGCHGDT